jgi:hypothetical protein
LNDATSIDRWIVALITDKLNGKSTVDMNVITIKIEK